MTTQLFIAGIEAVLPQAFTITVKRENPLFTKSGEYTYDVQLRLDNPVNQQLFAFLHRLNKSEQIDTRRTVALLADGHVVTRGTEVITQWTSQDVTLQIVSGTSELNWLIGQDRKVSSLRMDQCSTGWVTYINSLIDQQDAGQRHDLLWPKYNCCYPMVRDEAAGVTYNQPYMGIYIPRDTYEDTTFPVLDYRYTQLRPQPFLCALVEGIIKALGYEVGTDELSSHPTFCRAFITNTADAQSLDQTLPGWTVKDFLTEVEKLTGCCMLVRDDRQQPDSLGTVDILMKTTFYAQADIFTLHDVVDEYQAQTEEEPDITDQSTADIAWELPDSSHARLAMLPQSLRNAARIIDCDGIGEVRHRLAYTDDHVIAHDTRTDRYWILDSHQITDTDAATEKDVSLQCTALRMVDYLRPLERTEPKGQMTLAIVPAMIDWGWFNASRDPNTNLIATAAKVIILSGASKTATADTEEEKPSFGDFIRQSEEPAEEQKAQLYVALFNGLQWRNTGKKGAGFIFLPTPYIDEYQATVEPGYNDATYTLEANAGFEGSLLLPQLDVTAYSARMFTIDTTRTVTFQTFDPNHADPRHVYLIQGRFYVVRDIEETYGPDGRQPLWTLTCFPFTVTDAAAFQQWVLTQGVWDDGALWLDDGRWNDYLIN